MKSLVWFYLRNPGNLWAASRKAVTLWRGGELAELRATLRRRAGEEAALGDVQNGRMPEAVAPVVAPTAAEVGPLLGYYARYPNRLLRAAGTGFSLWRKGGNEAVRAHYRKRKKEEATGAERKTEYGRWVAAHDTLTDADRAAIRRRIAELPAKPLISVVMPVYNVEERWLVEAIESVREQLYENWELCVADDCSPKKHIRKVLARYARLDPRIKVVYRETNGHISEASNSALDLATGEFVALLDHDDILPEHALYLIAEELAAHPDADLIYSDEDKIDADGERSDPHFKPDWSPDLFYSYNFISHLGVYRRSVLRDIGGFRKGFEGSQDYDLALRVIERVPESHIRHIPRVLYHWRIIPGSVALHGDEKGYAHDAARRALQEHFERRGQAVSVVKGTSNYHRVEFPPLERQPKVSILIGTRDRVGLLFQTVEGVLKETDYPDLEIIIVNNQSAEPETYAYFSRLKDEPRVRVVDYDAPFNFSAINNYAATFATGEVILLLNNDIKVIHPEWLTELVRHVTRPDVGAVGAKLYYEDGTIQHAGVILGMGGIAGHQFRLYGRDQIGYFARTHVIQNLAAVTGACLATRREVFEQVGGLEEKNLPIAFNDVDLCLKIHAAGYRIVWTPFAELFHLESASRGSDLRPERLPAFIREQEYMKERWGHILFADPFYNPNLSLSASDFALADPPRVAKPWEKS